MPLLDVSEVLTDPDFADTFTVTRRVQTVDANGRTVNTEQTFSNVVGVVCMASPNDLLRLDDQDRTGKVISVISKFRLHATVTGAAPDIITWRGDQYIVTWLDQYTHYGQGQVQTLCKLFKQSQSTTTGQLPWAIDILAPAADAELEVGEDVDYIADNLGQWDSVLFYIWLSEDEMPTTGVAGTYDAETNSVVLSTTAPEEPGAYSVVAVGAVLGGTVTSPTVNFTVVEP